MDCAALNSKIGDDEMNFQIDPAGVWYHGSDRIFDLLAAGSTVTQWRELAEAFSHKPKYLFYTKRGKIYHTGRKRGYLYVIDEPVVIGRDIYPHPRTTMDKDVEYITARPFRVRRV